MKSVRAASVIVSLCLLSPAWAEVRLVSPSQNLEPPHPDSDVIDDVAIDGGFIIALAHEYGAGQESAYLYRRSISTGRFTLFRTLLQSPGANAGGDVVMKNGIAAVRIGTQVTIFENSGGTYVPGHTAAPLTHPGGLAISGKSVLAGGDGCSDDAVVYQKGADGNWGITGRIDDHQGDCHPEGLLVDLNYDYALVTVPHADHATAWRRNGTALDWVPAGTLNLPAGADAGQFPFVLEKSTAVSPGDYVFRRSGSTWTRTSRALGVDYYRNSSSIGGVQVLNRDGLLVTNEATLDESGYLQPHVFQETTSGRFENLAILRPSFHSTHIDLSGHTLIASTDTLTHGGVNGVPFEIAIFDLPTQVSAPTPVVDDFEDGDVSEFTFSGGQFALTPRGSNHVLVQGSSSGLALAIRNDTDWTKDQVVEADITFPSNSDSWVGLVARYVDANNYYYLALHNNLTYRVYKRVNGVDTLLQEGTWTKPAHVLHVRWIVSADGTLSGYINGGGFWGGEDTTFTHGRAGLATFQTHADFDNVHVANTDAVSLLYKSFDIGPILGKDFTEQGGQWQLQKDAQQNNAGFAQLDPTVYALAHTGVPVENQEIDATVRLDSFDTSTTSGWFGLLARYQDPQNYYYVAIRSKNQIQVRKVVSGVTTILAAAPFTAQPGTYHDFRFSLINDQLHLLVDGALVAAAHDDSFTSGQYGIGTYRAAATWKSLSVIQP